MTYPGKRTILADPTIYSEEVIEAVSVHPFDTVLYLQQASPYAPDPVKASGLSRSDCVRLSRAQALHVIAHLQEWVDRDDVIKRSALVADNLALAHTLLGLLHEHGIDVPDHLRTAVLRDDYSEGDPIRALEALTSADLEPARRSCH
jgi:hypothetical protein